MNLAANIHGSLRAERRWALIIAYVSLCAAVVIFWGFAD